MSDFSDQLKRQFWTTMNAKRELEFGGAATLKLIQATPQGETELIELANDWGGYRVVSVTETPADMNAWRFFVKARAELSDALMAKAKLAVIGGRKWKVTYVEQPTTNLSHWTLRAELTR